MRIPEFLQNDSHHPSRSDDWDELWQGRQMPHHWSDLSRVTWEMGGGRGWKMFFVHRQQEPLVPRCLKWWVRVRQEQKQCFYSSPRSQYTLDTMKLSISWMISGRLFSSLCKTILTLPRLCRWKRRICKTNHVLCPHNHRRTLPAALSSGTPLPVKLKENIFST